MYVFFMQAARVRLSGTWHWLVEYDGNIVVDLHRLGPFLRRRREQALAPKPHFAEACIVLFLLMT